MSERFIDGFEVRCEQRWDEMRVEGDGRHCQHCDRTVIDLTRLTRKQAQPYLRSREALCVRVIVDVEGDPVFRIDPKKGVGVLVAAALAACAAPLPTAPSTERTHQPAPSDAGVMEPSAIPVGISAEEIDWTTLASQQPVEDDVPVGHPGPKAHPHIALMGVRPAPNY